jgi:hypothetical protein
LDGKSTVRRATGDWPPPEGFKFQTAMPVMAATSTKEAR